MNLQISPFIRIAAAGAAGFVLCCRPALGQVGVRGWPTYGGDSQHTARSYVAANDMLRIRWSTPVDQNPQYSGGDLLIHYGATLLTANNTVVVTVKTGASGNYQIQGRRATDGALLYTETTDWIGPNTSWTPSCGSTITPDNRLVTPAAGGTVLIRANADDPSSNVTRVAFYGIANYNADTATFNSNVKVDTPIVSDANGNVYFGFLAGTNPLNLRSGLARISAAGVGTWVSAATMTADSNAVRVPVNATPAISNDGSLVYTATNGGGNYLVAVDSTTLATVHKVLLHDPRSGNVAGIGNDGTASPMVGPDGDVYYGIQESPGGSNRLRGWMLHFSGDLATQKPSGAFGWDDTASVVPAGMVPSYGGSSSYLLLTKYNDYLEGGGPGDNRIAILDPNATAVDPISGILTMQEVLTKLGPTTDPRGGVVEWCINTAAIDPLTHSAIVNSEDGKGYRWDLATNTLSQTVTLTTGVGEAYTPTAVGPDGTVYCINNGLLFAISDNRVWPTSYSLFRGTLSSGTLASLNYSDDNRLVVKPGAVLSSAEAPVQEIINATSFTPTASSLKFTLEAHVNTANLQQKIELYNYLTAAYETVDSRPATSADTIAEVTVSANASRFIEAGTKAMRARVSFKANGPVLTYPWQSRVDQAIWTVTP